MRRLLTIAVAVAVLFSLGLALAPLLPADAAPQAAVPQQRGEESTCVPESNKVAYPNVLLLGEETNITLTVRALCAPEAFPLHIVLVLDASGSMAGQKNAELKAAVKQMVRQLDLDESAPDPDGHRRVQHHGQRPFASSRTTLAASAAAPTR